MTQRPILASNRLPYPSKGNNTGLNQTVLGVFSMASDTGNNGAFQYILNACTSIATKVNEPSITYLNQGQAYEVTLKKMQEFPSMTSQRRRLIKCQIRICFHERRLQYMELEQVRIDHRNR